MARMTKPKPASEHRPMGRPPILRAPVFRVSLSLGADEAAILEKMRAREGHEDESVSELIRAVLHAWSEAQG